MNERLTVQDLTDLLAAKHGMTKKDAEAFVKEFFLLIEQALESDQVVKVKGLGTFKLIDVDSRESVNVNTGERFKIKGHTKVTFAPDTSLKDTVNKPFAHFETVTLNENTVLEDTASDEEEEEDENTTEQSAEELMDVTDAPALTASDEVIPIVAAEEPVIEEAVPLTENIAPLTEEATPLIENIVPVAEETTPLTEEAAPQPENEVPIVPLAKEEETFPAAELIIAQALSQEKAPSQEKFTAKEKASVSFLIAIVLIVLVLCGGVIVSLYYPDLFSPSINDKIEMSSEATQPTEPEVALLDTIEPIDTVKKITPDIKPELEIVKSEPEAVKAQQTTPTVQTAESVYDGNLSYKITGTKQMYKLKVGETLTKVSLQFYGTKAMWPYIVKHNADIIKNPDNVPHGTTIKIPELVQK